MSVQSTDTVPKVDYSAMTLDALRRLADSSPDASTRAGARRELEGRVAPAGEHVVMCRVSVGQSEYTTPRPRIVVSLRGLRGQRHVAAMLHDLAAELERELADTLERWSVGVHAFAEDNGEVYLELMTGSPAEVQRAVSVLERVAGQTATTGRAPGRRPGKQRRTVAAPAADTPAEPITTPVAPVDTAIVASDVQPADRVPAAPGLADESESRSRRRKRQRYREVAGDAADSFEREQLSGDALPECARVAVAGGPKGGAYWEWLLEQWQAAARVAS